MSNAPETEKTQDEENEHYDAASPASGGLEWRVWDSRRLLSSDYYTEKIAWPVYAWRVVVPQVKSTLDPLQRAILRLADAQNTHAGEIARLLGIHPDLARHLQLICLHEGVLDTQFRLTKIGRDKILGLERDEEGGETEDGWIFRDGVTGDVLPLFYRGSLPILRRRTDQDYFRLHADSHFDSKPAVVAVANALRQYRRLLRVEEEERASDLNKDLFDPDSPMDWSLVSDNAEVSQESNSKVPKLVRILTAGPEWLAFEVNYYVSPDAPQAWYLTAPLGRAGGWWYRRKLEWAAERNTVLAKRLITWQQNAADLFAPSIEMALTLAQSRQEFAEFAQCRCLQETLVWWDRTRASQLRHQQGEFDADGVYTRCQRVLELLLNACIKEIADRRTVIDSIRWDSSRSLLEEMARNYQMPLPYKMTGQKIRESIAEGYLHALRDRALFLFYAAYNYQCDPFDRACSAEKDLLSLVDDVAELRNEYGAHSGRSVAEPDHDRLIEEAIDKTRRVLQALGLELCKQEKGEVNE